VTLIGLMCLGAMGLGFYRGWSDSFTAASDSEAEVRGSCLGYHACRLLREPWGGVKWV
jgi:hypothetical protein